MSASETFSQERRKCVEDAIANAEMKTSAEIVAAVAVRSGRYDRAEDAFGLLFSLVVFSIAAVIWRAQPGVGTWDTTLRPDFGLGLTIVVVAAAWGIGAFLATRFPFLVRPLISKRHMLAEVQRRGAEVFHACRIRRTAGASGVLIFVSRFERMVWVCPDDNAAPYLNEEHAAQLRDRILEGFRNGEPDRGLAEAIALCGELLAAPLPRAGHDQDELPNTLHVLD